MVSRPTANEAVDHRIFENCQSAEFPADGEAQVFWKFHRQERRRLGQAQLVSVAVAKSALGQAIARALGLAEEMGEKSLRCAVPDSHNLIDRRFAQLVTQAAFLPAFSTLAQSGFPETGPISCLLEQIQVNQIRKCSSMREDCRAQLSVAPPPLGPSCRRRFCRRYREDDHRPLCRLQARSRHGRCVGLHPISVMSSRSPSIALRNCWMSVSAL